MGSLKKRSYSFLIAGSFIIPGLLLALLACLLLRAASEEHTTLRGAADSKSGCPPGTFVSDDGSCTPCMDNTVSASFDSPNCLPCPAILVPNEDRTECGCPSGKILNNNGGCDLDDAAPPFNSLIPSVNKASNCNGKGKQCGGIGYTGETCCRTGYTCEEENEWWSACRVNPASGGCATLSGQCGGTDWNGHTCCIDGFTCVSIDQWFSHCVDPSDPPATPSPKKRHHHHKKICKGKDELCGGIGHTGETCCRSGYSCVEHKDAWSSCKVNPASGGCATLWEQCGGENWNGATCCIDGFTCHAQDQWFSQCRDPYDLA